MLLFSHFEPYFWKEKTQNCTQFPTVFGERAFTSEQILLFSVSVWNYLSWSRRKNRVREDQKRNKTKHAMFTQLYYWERNDQCVGMYRYIWGSRNVDNKFSSSSHFVLSMKWFCDREFEWTHSELLFLGIWILIYFGVGYIFERNEIERSYKIVPGQ